MSSTALSPKRSQGISADRALILLAGALLTGGFLVFFLVSLAHAGMAAPNNHRAVFAQYAASSSWIAVHLGIFVGYAALVLGAYLLFSVFRFGRPAVELTAKIGLVCAGVALGLTAARSAVDGIMLKRAVDAWVAAPAPLKAGRFAQAEGARWLEEAMTSYQGIVLGVALVLLAVLIVVTGRVSRTVGWLLGIAGVANIAVGWIVGASGFAPQGAIPSYVGQTCLLVAGAWLLVTTWRAPTIAAPDQRLPEQRASEPAPGTVTRK